MLVRGIEIDKSLSWPFGHAEKLARRHKLPHIVLPDGGIRFEADAVKSTLREVPAQKTEGNRNAS